MSLVAPFLWTKWGIYFLGPSDHINLKQIDSTDEYFRYEWENSGEEWQKDIRGQHHFLYLSLVRGHASAVVAHAILPSSSLPR